MILTDTLVLEVGEGGEDVYVIEEYDLRHILEDYIFWHPSFDQTKMDVPEPFTVKVKRLDGREEVILKTDEIIFGEK